MNYENACFILFQVEELSQVFDCEEANNSFHYDDRNDVELIDLTVINDNNEEITNNEITIDFALRASDEYISCDPSY